jgi:hypothetical protein
VGRKVGLVLGRAVVGRLVGCAVLGRSVGLLRLVLGRAVVGRLVGCEVGDGVVTVHWKVRLPNGSYACTAAYTLVGSDTAAMKHDSMDV